MILVRENVLNLKKKENYNGINLEEISNICKINLRGNIDDKDFIKNVELTLNILLPSNPNTSNGNEELKIIWLGPNEWLIQINNENIFYDILSKFQSRLNPENTAVTDVSENRTIIKAKGKQLYKLLSKFMVIDLDKVLKKEFSVAQTIFVKIPILIVRIHKDREDPIIEMHTNRSHANYLYGLLVDGTNNLDF